MNSWTKKKYLLHLHYCIRTLKRDFVLYNTSLNLADQNFLQEEFRNVRGVSVNSFLEQRLTYKVCISIS